MDPFRYEKLSECFKKRYPRLSEVIWVQEEPKNMGEWNFVRSRMSEVSTSVKKVSYAGRKNSGSTAEGSSKAHAQEQKRILESAFSQALKNTNETKAKPSKKS